MLMIRPYVGVQMGLYQHGRMWTYLDSGEADGCRLGRPGSSASVGEI